MDLTADVQIFLIADDVACTFKVTTPSLLPSQLAKTRPFPVLPAP
jgi:hypothetical protein